MDGWLGAVQQVDPLWAVVLVAIALVLLLGARFSGAWFGRMLAGLVALVLVTAIAGGSHYGYRHLEDTRRLAERDALDERATVLFQQTIQPGSVFACIDGSPVPSVLDACERNLFAEPPSVAAAVAIVTQRLGFLTDALKYAKERDPVYFERIETMRKAVEGDPYGFVAFVMSVEHGCTVEACRRYDLLRDPTRVRENMRVQRLEAFLAKYSMIWKDADAKPAEVSTVAPSVTISEPVIAAEPDGPGQPDERGMSPTPSASDSEISDGAANSALPPTPAAASAPVITPPADADFEEPTREAPSKSAPANARAAKSSAVPASPNAARSPLPRPASRARAKAKADPVRRTNEPVAGLPRVVPGDYVREDPEEEAAAQASGQAGAPTPISPPRQNFTVR